MGWGRHNGSTHTQTYLLPPSTLTQTYLLPLSIHTQTYLLPLSRSSFDCSNCLIYFCSVSFRATSSALSSSRVVTLANISLFCISSFVYNNHTHSHLHMGTHTHTHSHLHMGTHTHSHGNTMNIQSDVHSSKLYILSFK